MHDHARLSEPAREMLLGMSTFYRVRPGLLLRVIVESYLDAASEDGDVQRELAGAARSLRCTGCVPGCWQELEDDTADDEASEPAEDAWLKSLRRSELRTFSP